MYLRTVRVGDVQRLGFSLAEVILAASLLALVMMMMFNLFPTSMISIRQAEHRLEGSSRAQHVLEYYRSLPFKTLLKMAGGTISDIKAFPNDPISDDGTIYHADLLLVRDSLYEAVCPNPPSPTASPALPAYLLKLTVTVYWNERVDDPAGAYTSWHGTTKAETDVCAIQ